MKRREFVKKAALTGVGAAAFPYILPSGRLFARTNAELADHVVYVLFAGGVRHQEAVQQLYLSGSQDLDIGGNIMYNMLNGTAPDRKIVYGITPAGEPDGSSPIPPVLSTSLQSQGLFFPEVTAQNGGHYGGLTSLLTGNRSIAQGLKVRPVAPTIFEYLRRHRGFKASDVWFVGSGIGNSFPLLNSSDHPQYGTAYGANFVAPSVTFGADGVEILSNAKVYHPQEELEPIQRMRAFLNNTFRIKNGDIDGIRNDENERENIKAFIRQTFDKKQTGGLVRPPILDNGDLVTVQYAAEVLKYFKPKILVLNLTNVDGCHSNFTGYLRSLHRADHAVGWLWKFIQNDIPEMAGKTIMLTTPECGRNLNPNPIQDENDWFAYDHSGDFNTRRIFTMMAGPNIPSNLTVGSETNRVGRATDNVLTIAEIFGIKDAVAAAGQMDAEAKSLFDQI
ncbi:MAG: hypothetical protein H6608_07530 [Flavobacteriales bacterium]|nr:hypothetical protein [Flavobacteriales bacterium]